MSKGCIVVLRPPQELQSTMNYEIPNLVEEKCFHQERSGEYTVAVFKKTTNKTLNAIPLNVSVVSVSSLTPITRKLNDNVILLFKFSVFHYAVYVGVVVVLLLTSAMTLILYMLYIGN